MITARVGRLLRSSTAAATLAIVGACATAHTGVGGPAALELSGVQNVVDDKLVFGRSIPTGGIVSDSAWNAFMTEVVSPRFPAGLTVWQAQGQWLDPRGALVHESVMVVEVLHPSGAPADSVFARVAELYRTRFHQDAVLRITADARTEMYESH